MDYKNLGRSGLKVSRLALGTMNFGPLTPKDESFAIMDRALEAGINFFDTADVYGRKKGEGVGEQLLGEWFAQGGGRREQVVLATKHWGPMGDGPNDRGSSALHIKRACEDSLRRLGTDYIDLYQMHHIDRNTPWEEKWQALEQLVREGKVLYIGSSNFAGWHIADAQHLARQRHFMGLVSEQSVYNLAERDLELEVIPACEHFGLGLLPWSPLGGGALAGYIAKQQGVRRNEDPAQGRLKAHYEQIEAYEDFCRELGEHPAEVALAWLMHQPAVTAPIHGVRTMEHLESGLRAAALKLDQDTLKRLDDIFPGYKTAPEHYAF